MCTFSYCYTLPDYTVVDNLTLECFVQSGKPYTVHGVGFLVVCLYHSPQQIR